MPFGKRNRKRKFYKLFKSDRKDHYILVVLADTQYLPIN